MEVTLIPITDLKPHPRNYQQHPKEQLQHIIESINTHGFYRNVVVARDNTILAGHGVTLAAKTMGRTEVPVIRLDIDPNSPEALKVLVSDNEINNLAQVDDRELTELLRTIMQDDMVGLLGTGFDEAQLAALVMVTRPASEIRGMSEAAEWLGMPDYEEYTEPLRATISFLTPEDRTNFFAFLGIPEAPMTGRSSTVWWPPKQTDDTRNVQFQDTVGS